MKGVKLLFKFSIAASMLLFFAGLIIGTIALIKIDMPMLR